MALKDLCHIQNKENHDSSDHATEGSIQNVTEDDVNEGIMACLLFQHPIDAKEYWTDLYILY